MTDRSAIDRLLAANLYLVLATADEHGTPWASPVFYAPITPEQLCWVSSPDSRHSRNIAQRPTVAITAFDSTVAVGAAEAAYFDADASEVPPDDVAAVLGALNRRLPPAKQLTADDLRPDGSLVAYRADVRRSYLLVRGGNPDLGNDVDVTYEV